jgi:hypothetical protein
MAAVCIIDPVKEISWPDQRRRKFRFRKAIRKGGILDLPAVGRRGGFSPRRPLWEPGMR